MATIKLILLTAAIVGLVFAGLSLKVILGKTKRNECDGSSSDAGYSCGCGGGSGCSANGAKDGF